MEPHNSGPGFYLGLISELYRDIAECYSVTCRVQNIELRYLADRCSKEGISFLTKSLPRLGKAFDRALSNGVRFDTTGWKADGTSTPLFMGWLLKRVFSAAGYELVEPDPIAVKHFRQFVYLLYKLEIPYAKKTEEKVISAFIETESLLPEDGADCRINCDNDIYHLSSGTLLSDEWLKQARGLAARVITVLDPYEVKPRHGPGAVATGEDVFEKTQFNRVYPSLERVYPLTEYMRFNLNHVAEAIPAEDPKVTLMDEPTAKVVLVPKDSRGPRLISCEPLEVQWMQQGLKTLLTERIESYWLTRGFVNFTNQEINRKLALLGSKNGEWVTLDMKEASDRVSLELVKYLFQDHPPLLAALLATRSPQTLLPNGTVLKLKKFAPMGSAVCFPVEALIFWALSVSAVRQTGVPWLRAIRSVFVYGDDIIVRDKDYTTLLRHLPIVGLKFNDDKCCTARFFRESCGCDAYAGVDVTPVKLKTVFSHCRFDPKSLESYVALRNALYGLGYFRAAEYVKLTVDETYGVLPFTNRFDTLPNGAFSSTTGCAAYVCHEPAHPLNQKLRLRSRVWSSRKDESNYGRIQYFTWVSSPKKEKTTYDGYAEWLRRLSTQYGQYGGIYAMTRRNRLKRVWAEA